MSDNFSKAIDYILTGQHAFIAIDESSARDRFVDSLAAAVASLPIALIDGREAASGEAFSRELASACNRLIQAIGETMPSRSLTVSGFLRDAMHLFQLSDKQGFLVFVHIDPMIESQSSFEIEGALRSAMERYDDIGVVLCGSEMTIDKMRQHDRPFYCSFRTFGCSANLGFR